MASVARQYRFVSRQKYQKKDEKQPLVKKRYLFFVRIRLLGIDSTGRFDVLKSIIEVSAIAAIIVELPTAIHQLLLRQGHQLPRLPEMLPLQRSRGAEGPARSTESLNKKIIALKVTNNFDWAENLKTKVILVEVTNAIPESEKANTPDPSLWSRSRASSSPPPPATSRSLEQGNLIQTFQNSWCWGEIQEAAAGTQQL